MRTLSILVCAVLILASNQLAADKCQEIEILLIIDPSDMSPLEMLRMKSYLLRLFRELDNSQMLRATEIYLRIFSYSRVRAFYSDSVSVRDWDLVEQLIQSFSALPFKSNVSKILGDSQLEKPREGVTRFVVIATKSAEHVFDRRIWYYEPVVEEQINFYMNLETYFFVMELDEEPRGPVYLYSEPQCAFNIRMHRNEELLSMIETIEHLACQQEFFSRNCNSRPRNLACISRENAGQIEILCDKKFTRNDRSVEADRAFPAELFAYPEADLDRLTSLEIKNFNLSFVHASLFANLSSKLDVVSLQYNNIQTVDSLPSANWTYLSLDRNRIVSIESGAFRGLKNLTELTMTDNELTALNRDDLAGLASLAKLDLRNNLIERLDDGCFADLTALKNLTMTNNTVTRLSNNVLRNLTNLEYLLMDQNRIASVEDDAFEANSKLVCLVLTSNRLESISGRLFRSLAKIRWLFIAGNRLKYIDVQAFKSMTVLEWADLSDNHLCQRSVPKFYSERLFYISLSNQTGALQEITEQFFNDKLVLSASEQLFFYMNSNELRAFRRNASVSALDRVRQLSLQLSLHTFVSLTTQDICNLKHFSLGPDRPTNVIMNEVLVLDKDHPDMVRLMTDCELRLQMAKLGINVPFIKFPSFGSVCLKFDYKNLRKCA